MKLFIAFLSFVSFPAFASVKNLIKCQAQADILYGQFEGSAIVHLSEYDHTAHAELDFVATRPGANDAAVKNVISGTYKNYPAGTMGPNQSQSLQFIDKDGVVTVAVLNLGFAGPLTSTLIVDGVTYKSACEVAQ